MPPTVHFLSVRTDQSLSRLKGSVLAGDDFDGICTASFNIMQARIHTFNSAKKKKQKQKKHKAVFITLFIVTVLPLRIYPRDKPG